MSGSGASNGSRGRSRWSLDFGTRPQGSRDLPAPPGYLSSANALHAEAIRPADPGLRAKRSWDMALGPIKQVPMNLFIMYMSGNTISIFPIMMVVMMAVRPFKTLLSVNATFKALDAANSGSTDGEGGSGSGGANTAAALGQKIVFVLGNLANVALAMYKCHSMGLLPTHASDWLAFADPVARAEWAYAAVG